MLFFFSVRTTVVIIIIFVAVSIVAIASLPRSDKIQQVLVFFCFHKNCALHPAVVVATVLFSPSTTIPVLFCTVVVIFIFIVLMIFMVTILSTVVIIITILLLSSY